MRLKNPDADDLVIKATSDLFIATLFSAPKNEPILRSLINAVLKASGGTLIRKATVLNPFNVKEFFFVKQIVLDVRVEDERGRVYNIEIQTTPHTAFAERILFGWADTFSAQLHAGNKYKKLQPVFCIVITEFNFLPSAEGVYFVFELRDRNNPNILLSNHLQIHVLRLYDVLQGRREMLNELPPEFQHWTNFLAFGGTMEEEEMSILVENDPIVMGAVGELQHFASDPGMREMERRHKLWQLEYHTGLETAREEGEARKSVASIVKILSRKETVSGRLLEKINSITDIEVLDNLIDAALDCKSLGDFEKNLD